MAIDFSFPEDVQHVVARVQEFCKEIVRPAEEKIEASGEAPDEGNMHTLHHWATPEQKKKYLKPLCDGRIRSCFAMTEPEVAGSDPTLIQTRARLEGNEWVGDGHKWFTAGARAAKSAILSARPEDAPELPQAANSAFLVDIPSEGWEVVRDI